MFETLKRLFLVDELHPDRRQLLAALAMMWFPTLFHFIRFMATTFSFVIFAGVSGDTLVEYGAWANLARLVLPGGISWTFVLFVACIVLVRMLYRRMPLLIHLLGGWTVYCFFIAPIISLMYFTGMRENFGGSPGLQSVTPHDSDTAILVVSFSGVVGLGLIILSLVRARPFGANNRPSASSDRLDSEAFILRAAVLNMTGVVANLLVLYMNALFPESRLFMFIVAVLMLPVAVQNLVISVRRLRDIGVSFFVFLIPLAALGALIGSLFLFRSAQHVALRYFGNASFALSLATQFFFFLWLCLAPSRRKETADPGMPVESAPRS